MSDNIRVDGYRTGSKKKKRIYVRVVDNMMMPGKFDVVVQTEGYPATTGYVDEFGDTAFLKYEDAKAIAPDVVYEVQQGNPDAEVIYDRTHPHKSWKYDENPL